MSRGRGREAVEAGVERFMGGGAWVGRGAGLGSHTVRFSNRNPPSSRMGGKAGADVSAGSERGFPDPAEVQPGGYFTVAFS